MGEASCQNRFSIGTALAMAKAAFMKHFWLLFFTQAFMTLGIRQLAEIFPGMWIFNFIADLNGSWLTLIIKHFFPQAEIPQLSKDIGEWVSYLSGSVMQPLCAGGSYAVLLAVVDGNEAKFSDIFSKTNLFWRFFFSNLLLTLGFILNFAVLCIPFVFSVKHRIALLPMGLALVATAIVALAFVANFSFHQLLIVDKNLSVRAAFGRSWQITKGCRKKLFAFFALLLLISVFFVLPAIVLVGFVGPFLERAPFLLKLLLSSIFCAALLPAPIYWQLAWISCYRQLVKNESNSELEPTAS